MCYGSVFSTFGAQTHVGSCTICDVKIASRPKKETQNAFCQCAVGNLTAGFCQVSKMHERILSYMYAYKIVCFCIFCMCVYVLDGLV